MQCIENSVKNSIFREEFYRMCFQYFHREIVTWFSHSHTQLCIHSYINPLIHSNARHLLCLLCPPALNLFSLPLGFLPHSLFFLFFFSIPVMSTTPNQQPSPFISLYSIWKMGHPSTSVNTHADETPSHSCSSHFLQQGAILMFSSVHVNRWDSGDCAPPSLRGSTGRAEDRSSAFTQTSNILQYTPV